MAGLQVLATSVPLGLMMCAGMNMYICIYVNMEMFAM